MLDYLILAMLSIKVTPVILNALCSPAWVFFLSYQVCLLS